MATCYKTVTTSTSITFLSGLDDHSSDPIYVLQNPNQALLRINSARIPQNVRILAPSSTVGYLWLPTSAPMLPPRGARSNDLAYSVSSTTVRRALSIFCHKFELS
ncbi:hypothetical protein FRC12_017265 [Ceratobasidium sp. 428]|nr:hypothetical protein FRC12_017265 [Ceratobasidium sp. 428]